MLLNNHFEVQVPAGSVFALVSLPHLTRTFSRKVTFSLFSMPGGIYKSSEDFVIFIPVALQSPHGCLITSPIPWHLEHYKCITIELCRYIVEPEPPHARHRVGAVPGWHLLPLQVTHVPLRSNSNLILAPFIASTKLIFISFSMSSPRLRRDDPAE